MNAHLSTTPVIHSSQEELRRRLNNLDSQEKNLRERLNNVLIEKAGLTRQLAVDAHISRSNAIVTGINQMLASASAQPQSALANPQS